ncbi:MAG: hypothetical protein OK455_04780 [Thaumarchaeota archaeon]|nr:hypothetical protein [Nitrososphaerota archaeon]
MLVDEVLSKFPKDELPIRTVKRIQSRKRGGMRGLVGLTTYSVGPEEGKGRGRGRKSAGTQKLTFYSELLDKLSNPAAMGVIAHELAHSWLNEHVGPEASSKREREADELARRWGYGEYLDALQAETV